MSKLEFSERYRYGRVARHAADRAAGLDAWPEQRK